MIDATSRVRHAEPHESAVPGPVSTPVDRRAVTRAGLIVNPRSGGGSGKGLALSEQLRDARGVSTKIIERFEQIGGFIDELATDGVSDLFISSGDGTIQEILTQLAERKPFAHLPRIALLPHGTTNMTAADLGFRHRSIAMQADFMRNLTPAGLRSRPTIRCANPADGRPRHGMFVGTGAVADGTKYCQDAFNAKGVRGQWATFATLGGAVARTLFSAPDPTDPTRLDRPYNIAIEADGRQVISGTQLLVMSTTLEKLVMGARPFWSGRTGPIRTTSIPYPLPSVVRWMLPAMYGGENRRMPDGCTSFCSCELKISSNTMYVIDGEFFDSPKDQPLRLETGPAFTYVCG